MVVDVGTGCSDGGVMAVDMMYRLSLEGELDELERDRVAKNCYLFFQKISLMEQK